MSKAEDWPDVESLPHGSYRILEPARREFEEKDLLKIERRVSRAIFEFPELAGCVVNVGIQPPSSAWGQAYPRNWIVTFPSDSEKCPPSRMTVFHEVSHVACWVKKDEGYSHTSEPFTSILAVSRMGPGLVDSNRIPYIGKPEVERDRWPEICQRALDYRENHRNYIQKCREWLKV